MICLVYDWEGGNVLFVHFAMALLYFEKRRDKRSLHSHQFLYPRAEVSQKEDLVFGRRMAEEGKFCGWCLGLTPYAVSWSFFRPALAQPRSDILTLKNGVTAQAPKASMNHDYRYRCS